MIDDKDLVTEVDNRRELVVFVVGKHLYEEWK